MSWRKQGLLTQRPVLDPKCKLIISPFLTLPHLLDCLIFTRNAMSIVLLLQMMGEWARWRVVDLYQDVGGGTGDGYHLMVFVVVFQFFLVFVFCCLTFSVPLFRWLEHDGCCLSFFVFSLLSLSLVPLSMSYQCREIVVPGV